MGASFLRSVLVAGVATVTVGASALSPPPAAPADVGQNTPAAAAVSLTAFSKPLPPTSTVAIDLGSLEPEVRELLESSSINSAIKNVYNAVEPWVDWGFEVVQYVVGWIPIAGYFAPQITILYDFGESIVQSVVFNLDDWIFGPLPFFDGLRNVISDTWDASWNLLWNEINWLLPPLPPLPPIPPCPSWLCGSAVADTALTAALPDGDLDQKHTDSFASLLKFQIDATGDLTKSLGEALTLFAKDLFATGGQAITDLLEHGLVTAAVNAVKSTWESFVLRSQQAADGVTEYVDAQRDYFGGESTVGEDASSEDTDKPVALAVTEEDDAATATKKSDSPREADDDELADESESSEDGSGASNVTEEDGEEVTPPTEESADDAQEVESADKTSDPADADDSTGDDAGDSDAAES